MLTISDATRDRTAAWSVWSATALCLAGLLALAAPDARAQVEIEQVEGVASKIEGVTGEQLTAVVGEDAEGVAPTDALNLTGAPGLPGEGTFGARAVVEQRGDNNTATVTQDGSHDASVAQLGNRNEVSITQSPFGDFEGDVPDGVEIGATTDANNTAVAVQDGSENRTDIQQYGGENVAGVRFDGTSNEMELLQVGQGNEYLLDHDGSGVQLTGDRRIEQFGNNNLLRQETGSPVSVQMRGNGIRMEITQN